MQACKPFGLQHWYLNDHIDSWAPDCAFNKIVITRVGSPGSWPDTSVSLPRTFMTYTDCSKAFDSSCCLRERKRVQPTITLRQWVRKPSREQQLSVHRSDYLKSCQFGSQCTFWALHIWHCCWWTVCEQHIKHHVNCLVTLTEGTEPNCTNLDHIPRQCLSGCMFRATGASHTNTSQALLIPEPRCVRTKKHDVL